MTDRLTITPDPDRGGVILHLPEITHLDTQVWAADVGLTTEGLVALRNALGVPAAVEPPVDQAALRDRIRRAICEAEGFMWNEELLEPDEYGEVADAVLAVLPEPADQAADVPAAECSAQHHQFDDGRLCIRAAQHHGDHIDERGYHWSDTVAVYPVADGTFRTGVNRAALRRMADETPAAEAQAWQQEWDSRPNGADVSDLVDLQPAETYPPAAAGLPAGTLEAAEIGANRLDAWARSPQGRNFLAHALVQLARTGWLRTEPGEPFEPMRKDAQSPEPAAGARQDEPQPDDEPFAGDTRRCRACGHAMDAHIRVNGQIECAFEDCTDPTPGNTQSSPPPA